MPSIHPLSDLIAAARREGDSLIYPIFDDWGQGRATFGGLVASLSVHAMHTIADDPRPLRALQTNFIGPVGPGEMRVEVQQLRGGKNVSQFEARVFQNGELAAVLIGVFGSARESAVAAMRPQQPASRDAASLPDVPFVAGAMPNFIQRVGFRWAEGDAPFAGGKAMHSKIHVKLRDGAAVHPELLTVLLADAPPTPMLGHFDKLTMASSVSWSLELLPLEAPPGDGWWRVDTEVFAYAGGYGHQQTRLWTPEGALAALGYQVVAVFG